MQTLRKIFGTSRSWLIYNILQNALFSHLDNLIKTNYNLNMKNKETKNLLIIDDENFDFFDNFPSENIIKTNITNHSLNKVDIINWSKKFNGVLNRQYLKFNYNFSDKIF